MTTLSGTLLGLSLVAATAALATPSHAQERLPCSGVLEVAATNLRTDGGIVRIYLANSAESYAFGGTPFRTADIEPSGRRASVTFTGIPCGDYAIRLFHDENSNGRLDANFARIPTERYGFSNNARRRFGPADYEMARFSVNDTHVVMEIVAR